MSTPRDTQEAYVGSCTARSKLSTSAALFVPKTKARLSVKAAPFAPRLGAGAVETARKAETDIVGEVRATIENAFGGQLTGFLVTETRGEIEIGLDVCPPVGVGSGQSARKSAADTLAAALKSFGSRVVQITVTEDLSRVMLRLLPGGCRDCCWDHVRTGVCPRTQRGQLCRWSHVKAANMLFKLHVSEAAHVPLVPRPSAGPVCSPTGIQLVLAQTVSVPSQSKARLDTPVLRPLGALPLGSHVQVCNMTGLAFTQLPLLGTFSAADFGDSPALTPRSDYGGLDSPAMTPRSENEGLDWEAS